MRPSPRLRLRPIPTTDTEDMVSATAVDIPPLDTLDLDIPDSATAVATPDLATEATPVLEVSTESVRLRPSPRLRLRPRLRPIPTTDTDTPDLATLASGATEATAVVTPALDTPDLATLVATLAAATDTSDKKDPIYKGFQDQRKSERLQLNVLTG